MRHLLKTEREHIAGKMQNLENADKINTFVKTSIDKAKVKIESRYDLMIRVVRKEISDIWKDNLTLPGLIGTGEDCEFKSVAALGSFLYTNQDNLVKEVAQFNNKCSYNTQGMRHKIVKFREDMHERLDKENQAQQQTNEEMLKKVKQIGDRLHREIKSILLSKVDSLEKKIKQIDPVQMQNTVRESIDDTIKLKSFFQQTLQEKIDAFEAV